MNLLFDINQDRIYGNECTCKSTNIPCNKVAYY